MKSLQRPVPARLVFSILAATWEFWPELKRDLENEFGPTASALGPFPFIWSDYYNAELGGPPERRFISFQRLAAQDCLASIKLRALELEKRWAGADGRRRCNLDPGLLSHDRLVLASVKNYTQRIYLGHGIFADLTLIYRKGAWRTLDWTYPGYADKNMLAHLTVLRQEYGEEIKRLRLAPTLVDQP